MIDNLDGLDLLQSNLAGAHHDVITLFSMAASSALQWSSPPPATSDPLPTHLAPSSACATNPHTPAARMRSAPDAVAK
jgi:hypothetical protein